MPGLWIHLKDNPDFYDGFNIQKGEYYECTLYDEAHQEQGKSVWRVNAPESKKKDGIWTTGKVIAVSDEHLYWWLTKGGGRDASRRFHLHFCVADEAQCGKTKKKPDEEFHTDYFRSLDSADLVNLRVSWFKSAPAYASLGSSRPLPRTTLLMRWPSSLGAPRGAGVRSRLNLVVHTGEILTGASRTRSRSLK